MLGVTEFNIYDGNLTNMAQVFNYYSALVSRKHFNCITINFFKLYYNKFILIVLQLSYFKYIVACVCSFVFT